MEFFPDGLVVRLRSRGLYLYARDDGLGVSISPRRSSPSTGWEARRFQREGAADCIVLRSSATGRCLAVASAAAEESSTNQNHQRRRRAAAVQSERDRAAAWRAVWAGPRHGDVILCGFVGRKLCVEADARYGNGVFVQVEERRGKDWRTGTASSAASRWFVEAALPLPLRPAPTPPSPPPDPRYSRVCIPRLNLGTAASARLPILGTTNQFLGYMPARRIPGLVRFLADGNGGDEMPIVLQADAAQVGGEARNGQVVTALAFVAGRGITALPLHLQHQDQDPDPDQDGGEPLAREEEHGADADHAVQEEEHGAVPAQDEQDHPHQFAQAVRGN